jgi:hypothetical protein
MLFIILADSACRTSLHLSRLINNYIFLRCAKRLERIHWIVYRIADSAYHNFSLLSRLINNYIFSSLCEAIGENTLDCL